MALCVVSLQVRWLVYIDHLLRQLLAAFIMRKYVAGLKCSEGKHQLQALRVLTLLTYMKIASGVTLKSVCH